MGLLLFVTVTTGCDLNDIISVRDPGSIVAETLEDPAQAELMVRSALSDFECAFNSYIVSAGMLGDELVNGQVGSTWHPFDQRQMTPASAHGTSGCGVLGNYVPLSTARWQGDNVLEKFQSGGAWVDAGIPDAENMLATGAAVAGYSLLLLGEGMCSAAIDQGPELSPEQVFAEAEDRFRVALQAADDPEILNLARIGLGRTLLNTGDRTGAAAAVEAVPDGFVYHATRSDADGRTRNLMHLEIRETRRLVVESDFFDLEFDGVADSRVPVERLENVVAEDQVTPFWTQHKYTSRNDPIPIARWEEAQLIIAEAEGGETAVGIINELHERAGLPEYDPEVHVTPGPTEDEVLNHVIQERSRELFLEGHHLGDARRYALPLTPAVGEVYPFSGGGFYGDSRCFPLPNTETDNNPNI